MNSPSVRRLFWSVSATLAFLLAIAPVLMAQTGPAGQAGGAKIDLNTASQAALETLPGVDPATAKQIIKAAEATATGVEKGVSGASKGVQKGAGATASAAEKVDRKMTGTPRTPPQAGMVWADTDTKIYHKEGDSSYGKTKKGKWLTEQEAVKEGYLLAKPKTAGEDK